MTTCAPKREIAKMSKAEDELQNAEQDLREAQADGDQDDISSKRQRKLQVAYRRSPRRTQQIARVNCGSAKTIAGERSDRPRACPPLGMTRLTGFASAKQNSEAGAINCAP